MAKQVTLTMGLPATAAGKFDRQCPSICPDCGTTLARHQLIVRHAEIRDIDPARLELADRPCLASTRAQNHLESTCRSPAMADRLSSNYESGLEEGGCGPG